MDYKPKQILKVKLLDKKDMHPYWAAYFNMARHNFYTTLKHIEKMVGIAGNEKSGENLENQIDQMSVFKESNNPEIELAIMKMFVSHFPFIKMIITDDCNIEDEEIIKVASLSQMREALKTFSFTINYFSKH